MTGDDLERVVRRLPRIVRKRRGTMSLREAERDSGLCHMTIYRLEQGWQNPNIDTVIKALRWAKK